MCWKNLPFLNVPSLTCCRPLDRDCLIAGTPKLEKTSRTLNMSFQCEASYEVALQLARSQKQQNSSAWNACLINIENRVSLELIWCTFLLVMLPFNKTSRVCRGRGKTRALKLISYYNQLLDTIFNIGLKMWKGGVTFFFFAQNPFKISLTSQPLTLNQLHFLSSQNKSQNQC